MSAQLKPIDPELATAISVTDTHQKHLQAEFDRLRKVGTIAEYHAAERELNAVSDRLRDLRRQAGIL